MDKHLHIYYSGSVQGVGFRYVAQNTANQLGITGWVKNLPDGRVEMVCEGDAATLEKFLNRIKDLLGRYIIDSSIESERTIEKFEKFSIKF